VTPKHREKLQSQLLGWYARCGRDLPWRRTDDPYAIWISEVMLQQTQVSTVNPYYRRFLERFPTVEALAAAPLDAVLKAWEGLGYYGRARRAHDAAQRIVSEHGGQVPQTVELLLALPGVGRYTAGAIASMAFGLDEPVLDGNVARVLCRLFRVKQPPRQTATQKQLWQLARQLLPAGQAGLFNQALMDLGATVCVAKRPRCGTCPLIELCGARAHNEQDDLPLKAQRKTPPHHTVAVGIIWKDERFLLCQRDHEALLGGLWEFPGGRLKTGETCEECVVRKVQDRLAVRVDVRHRVASVKQVFTHFRITLHAYECLYVAGEPQALGCVAWRWVGREDVSQYALPKATHKVLHALGLGV